MYIYIYVRCVCIYIHISCVLKYQAVKVCNNKKNTVLRFFVSLCTKCEHWAEEFAGACETRENRESNYQKMFSGCSCFVFVHRQKKRAFVPQGQDNQVLGTAPRSSDPLGERKGFLLSLLFSLTHDPIEKNLTRSRSASQQKARSYFFLPIFKMKNI